MDQESSNPELTTTIRRDRTGKINRLDLAKGNRQIQYVPDTSVLVGYVLSPQRKPFRNINFTSMTEALEWLDAAEPKSHDRATKQKKGTK